MGELDYYLSTARYEGMPYAPLEALRAGVPVIATDVTGNREIALPGRSGLLFPAGDGAAGARLLLAELKAPTLSSADARQVFEERFTLNSMLHAIETLYQESAAPAVPQPAGV